MGEFGIDEDEAEIWAKKLNEFGVQDEVVDEGEGPSVDSVAVPASESGIVSGAESGTGSASHSGAQSASESGARSASESGAQSASESGTGSASELAALSASESAALSASESAALLALEPTSDSEYEPGGSVSESVLKPGSGYASESIDVSAEKPSVDSEKTRAFRRVEPRERHRPEQRAYRRRRDDDLGAIRFERDDDASHSGVRARAPERRGTLDTREGTSSKRLATRLLVTSVVMFGLTAGFLWKTREFNREVRLVRAQQKICSDRTGETSKPELSKELDEEDTDFESTAVVQIFDWKKSPVLSQRFFNADLEVVLPGGEFGSARIGDVIPAYQSQVTIVNLWASWCGPCQDEMKMFDATIETKKWGDEVGFVAINTLEDGKSLPHAAYETIAKDLPARAHRLADRSLDGGDVLDPLRAKNAKLAKVEKDKEVGLPITLVFDCRQRIRWAKFSALAKHDVDGTQLNSMARVIGELVAELPTSRCERRRSVKKVHKKKPLPVQVSEPEPNEGIEEASTGASEEVLIPEPPEVEVPAVPIQRPKNSPVVQPKPEPVGPFCGDDVCDSGENCRSCKDCACLNGLKCSSEGVPRCFDPGTDI